MSYATSSNFSSVLKTKGDAINTSMGGLVHAFNHNPREEVTSYATSMSGAPSHIAYEDGLVNAEFNAITEEERARRRKQEKELKMKEFMDKTKKNA